MPLARLWETVVPVSTRDIQLLLFYWERGVCTWMHTSSQAGPHTRAAALSPTFSSLAITMMDVEGSTSRLLSQTWRQKSWIKTQIFHPLLSFSLSASCFPWFPHDCHSPAHPHILSYTHIFFTAHQSILHCFSHSFSHSNNDLWIRAKRQRFTCNISGSILTVLWEASRVSHCHGNAEVKAVVVTCITVTKWNSLWPLLHMEGHKR